MITFLLEQVDISLHDENGKIAIEYLNRIVENLVFHHLVVAVLLDVLGVYFGLALHQQLLIALFYYCLSLVVGLLNFHFTILLTELASC